MTRIRNVRQTTKFKRSIKAISPVIATLLMIAIAVVASLVVYAWVTGYIGGTTSTAGKAIQIQSFASLDGNLVIYVQNVGQGDVELNRDQSVYVDRVLVKITDPADLKIPIEHGDTVELKTDAAYTAGTRVTIKVTTTDGTFMTTTGTGSSSSGGSTPGNNAPVINSFTPTDTTPDVASGGSIDFTVTATDADVGDTLSYSWYLDSAVQSSTTNAYTYSPASGTSHIVRADVTDSKATVSQSWTVTVSANNAPVINSFTPTDTTPDVASGGSIDFTVTATDADVGDTLSYSWYLDSAVQSSTTNAYTYSPASGTSHIVRADVTDSKATVSQSWTVTVSANNAPVITAFSPTDTTPSVNEGATLPFSVTATDADNDPLTYTWFVGTTQVQSGSSAAYSYSPDFSASGDHVVRVDVSDGKVTTPTSQSWTVTVNNVMRLHVQSVTVTVNSWYQDWTWHRQGTAVVHVHDENDNNVYSLTVTGTWSGSYVQTGATANADSSHDARFQTPEQHSGYVTYTFTVTNIAKTGLYAFDNTIGQLSGTGSG